MQQSRLHIILPQVETVQRDQDGLPNPRELLDIYYDALSQGLVGLASLFCDEAGISYDPEDSDAAIAEVFIDWAMNAKEESTPPSSPESLTERPCSIIDEQNKAFEESLKQDQEKEQARIKELEELKKKEQEVLEAERRLDEMNKQDRTQKRRLLASFFENKRPKTS